MLATLVNKPFDANGWLYEIKWDGFRAIAEVENNQVELYSRNLLSFNKRFSPVVKSLQGHKLKAILDGEIVIIDSKGKSRFELLQHYQQTGKGNLVYYVFDILFINGKDLRSQPLLERKKLLKKILPRNSHIKYSEHVLEHGKKLYQKAKKQTLEGIMAKDGQSPYRNGKRTQEWQKIKNRPQQEVVIGGFTKPTGARKKFGALVMGVYERGKLIYIGHVGTGFDEQTLNLVYNKLKPLIQKNSAFINPPETSGETNWVKPKLVGEVAFEEWTADGHMRQPAFLGLRTDKKASEVRKELPS